MSLINNPYNQRDPQQEEPITECFCGTQLYKGAEAYQYEDGEVVCSKECVLTLSGAHEITIRG